MKKLFLVFLICLGVVCCISSGIKVSASEERDATYNQVVSYISNHLGDLKKEYNKDHIKEPLRATSVEHHCLVYILDSKEYGVYMDFNDDKGYLVTTFTYSLYELNTTTDLDFLKNTEFTYYSSFDGFLYHDGTSYVKYNENLTRSSEVVYSYDGQGGDGESDIYDIDEYMADRYPSYKLEQTVDELDRDYRCISMDRTSYYIRHISKDGGYTYPTYETESNCALTAAFNVMSCWGTSGIFSRLPSKTTKLNIRNLIKEDPDYIYYGVGEETVGHDYYWTVNRDLYLENFPKLYYDLRLYALEHEGYNLEIGLTTQKTMNTMAGVLESYNYSGSSLKSTTSFTNVVSFLESGHAVFMGIAHSTAYAENHAVALIGYRKFSYKTGVWIFEKTHTAYFFIIDDGQSDFTCYFDPNCNSKLSYEFIYS